jgi:hypothetical protein
MENMPKSLKNSLFYAKEIQPFKRMKRIYLHPFLKIKMNFYRKIITASLLILTITNSQGQINSNRDSLLGQINTITTAVPFLLIAPDARAGGMGDYGVATSPDPNSIHWNPAKLSFADKKIGVSVSYTPWLRALVNDIYLAHLSGYTKLKNDQALAGSLLYFSLGNIDFTNEVGDKTSSFNPNEFAFDLAYSRKLGENFSGGLALRYIYSNLTGGALISSGNIQTKAGTSVAADISAYYRKPLDLKNKKTQLAAGIDISNIGSKISYSTSAVKDFIPMNFRIGVNWKIDMDEYNTISFGADVNKLLVPTPPVYKTDSKGNYVYDSQGNREVEFGKDPAGISVAQAIFSSWSDAPAGFKEELKEFTYSPGVEYWYDKQFAIRAGYFHEAATKGNRKFFTLGAGLRYNVFGLDFAYLIPTTQRNPLENTLRFTLLFNFEGLKAEDKSQNSNE